MELKCQDLHEFTNFSNQRPYRPWKYREQSIRAQQFESERSLFHGEH